MSEITLETLNRINSWLGPTFDEETKQQIKKDLNANPDNLEEAFYKDLEFGTGGMRGIMGVGTNRINKYTIGKNTQGLCNYLKKCFPNETIKVAIAYDCRHNSKSFGKVVADVFAANSIKTFLFEDLRPTPELSFTVRHLKCHCGIVLTASHNPPEYNGYKVYWQDGGQLVPPQDLDIIAEINAVNYDAVNFTTNANLIKYIGRDVDKAFINASVKNGSFNTNQKAKCDLKIVFTALHGSAITILPETLKKAGYDNVFIVEEQAEPNGNFPTVASPNPEDTKALQMALQLAEKHKADMVIGTDPDSDRLGIAVRNLQGNMVLLNGNQTMLVMIDFLLEQWKTKGELNGKQFVASTIVSTPMLKVLAKAYNTELKLALTGFKWIAKMVKDHSDLDFIGGGEESFGFMVGDFVRDKDAITSTLLASEIAAQAKEKGSSFFQKLLDLYIKYGFYKERLISFTKKGIEGNQEIKQMMINARKTPLITIAGETVVLVEDYLLSISKNLQNNTQTPIDLPKSNVLIYYTEKGSKIALRPSGTEPKIKFYISVNSSLDSVKSYNQKAKFLDKKIDTIIKDLKL